MARNVTLIVEDGTVVADANSFVDEAAIVAYALARGVTLPFESDEEQDAVAVLGITAMDYLWALPWRGELVDPSQTTPWPRKNMNVTPDVAQDEIPHRVLSAQLQLTMLAHNGTILLPTSTGTGYIIEERIGPIVNRYSEKVGVSTDGLPIIPGVRALLDPWLLGDTEGFVPVMIRRIGVRDYG